MTRRRIDIKEISIADELNDIANKTEEHQRGFERAMTLTDEIYSLKITHEYIGQKIAQKETQLAIQQKMNREMDEALINTRCFNISKRKGGSYRALSA